MDLVDRLKREWREYSTNSDILERAAPVYSELEKLTSFIEAAADMELFMGAKDDLREIERAGSSASRYNTYGRSLGVVGALTAGPLFGACVWGVMQVAHLGSRLSYKGLLGRAERDLQKAKECADRISFHKSEELMSREYGRAVDKLIKELEPPFGRIDYGLVFQDNGLDFEDEDDGELIG